MSAATTQPQSPASSLTEESESFAPQTGPQHTSGAWGRASLGLKLYLYSPFLALLLWFMMSLISDAATTSQADSVILVLLLTALPAIGASLFAMTPLPRAEKTLLKVTAGAFLAASAFAILGFTAGFFGQVAAGLAAMGLGLWVLPLLGWILMSFALKSTAETLEVLGVEQNVKDSWKAMVTGIAAIIAAIAIIFMGAVSAAVMFSWVSSVSFLVGGALHLAAASKVQGALAMRHLDEQYGAVGSDEMELA